MSPSICTCSRFQTLMVIYSMQNKDRRLLLLVIIFLILLLSFMSCTKKDEMDSSEKTAPPTLEQKGNTIIKDAATSYVALTHLNNFTDQLEKGYFSRAATSGPGTGEFVGKEFEFVKGDCANIDEKWLKTHRWRPDALGCSGKLFSSDWCARLKADHSIKYTLRFLSWTVGPEDKKQQCIGDCEKNNNQTAYVRTRFQPQKK